MLIDRTMTPTTKWLQILQLYHTFSIKFPYSSP